MESRIAQHPALEKAYRIFRSELEAQIASAKGALSQSGQACQDKLPELGIAFHRVKGGAGFFGLNEIARHAAELEDLLLKPLAQVQEHIQDVRRLVQELERCLGAISAPAAEGSKGKKDA